MNSIFIAVVWAHWNESRFLHLSQRIQIQLFFWDSLHAERRKFSSRSGSFFDLQEVQPLISEDVSQRAHEAETGNYSGHFSPERWPLTSTAVRSGFLGNQTKTECLFFFFFLFKAFFNVNSLQTEKSCLSSFAHESFLWFSFILWWQRSASVWLPSCWCQPRDTCSPRLSRFCMIQEP